MAIRQTTHILKNSDIVNRPLPSSLLPGEPIVNTADGIMYFSGVTTSTSEWTPAGTGATELTFFEVGSNLYDLRLRNRITQYEGVSGSGLVGKILSGTTNGLILVDSTEINGISAFTYNELTNTFTIFDSNGTQYPATLNAVSGLTVNGDLDVTGTQTVNDLTITGTGLYNTVATGTNPNEIVNYSSLTGFSLINDVYVTGNTLTPATDFTNTQQALLEYHGTPIGGPYVIDTLDTFTTGGTYDNNTFLITFDKNDGTDYTVDLSSLDINDTFVTGFTYNPSNNTFTISRNEGEPDLTASINTVSGLTVSNLTAGRVVYVGTGGLLTDEAGFTYDESINTFAVENIEAVGNVTIQGDLTVLGAAISAFTTNLYVEDPNITINYNPTGSTTVTSVNAGFTVQDGNGVTSGDVNLDIVRMQNLTGLTTTEIPDVSEYTGLTGYENRGWITQLNDIVIRSTDVSDGGSAGDINGVRVLAEWDVLDGGTY
jgi:hypothetical protein